jgi:hypothetical protein
MKWLALLFALSNSPEFYNNCWQADVQAGAVWSDAENWSRGVPGSRDRSVFLNPQNTTDEVVVDEAALTKKILMSRDCTFRGTDSVTVSPASASHWDMAIEVSQADATAVFDCDVTVLGTTDYVSDIRNYGSLTFNGSLTLTNSLFNRPVNFNAPGTTVINGDLHNHCGMRIASSTVRIGGSGATAGAGSLTLKGGRLELRRADALAPGTDVDFYSGTIAAGGYHQHFGALDLADSDVVADMEGTASVFTFADSSGTGWGTGRLMITNAGSAVVRFAGAGLSSGQLQQVVLDGQVLTDTVQTNGYLVLTPQVRTNHLSGAGAEISVLSDDDGIDRFFAGGKLFSDRSYTLTEEVPDFLSGGLFLRSSIATVSVEIVKSGILTVLTPESQQFASSRVADLEEQGFIRIANPELFQLFGTLSANKVRIYQKNVEAGERCDFRKWTVILGFSDAWNCDGSDARTLYNGIRLPAVWPPEELDPSSTDPMPVPYLEEIPSEIPIDVGRQLFVDDFLIESTELVRTFHYPEKYAGNPVLSPQTALELDPVNGLAVAAPKSGGLWWDPDEQIFKLWYEAGWLRTICYAESTNGIDWIRPDLDVVPGSNQVLPTGLRPDSWTVVPDWWTDDPDSKYKIFVRAPGGTAMGAMCFESPDGIHFGDYVTSGVMGDRSTMFYNPFRKKWVFSLRASFTGRGRARHYREADDFMAGCQWDPQNLNGSDWQFGQPVVWTGADELDPSDPVVQLTTQLYNLDAVAYESIMLGFYQIWRGPNNQDCLGVPKITELNFAYSRDGFHWDRPDRTTAIEASRDAGTWDRGYVQSLGNICVLNENKIWFYYTGFAGDTNRPSNGMYANGAMGIAALRRDGFASMDAYGEGSLLTRPVIFSGKHLFINADVPQGSLRADVLDADGTVLAESISFTGDSTIQRLAWKNGSDLSWLAGQTVRFRFTMEDGALYSFWVSRNETGRSDGFVAGGGPGYTGPTDTVGTAALGAD